MTRVEVWVALPKHCQRQELVTMRIRDHGVEEAPASALPSEFDGHKKASGSKEADA
ncbi:MULTISPECIES: hypothetical protein [Streptosporangium]|uniref:Uncharacterized protein n=1 Tax=Streptosporangium brasiliense TaxID=47480 RepID=A0ABT9RJV3_9ACTN|nr:hypothetical protein [Streptosporangium brasiliense]MDP9869014.1 hypothetical protein [Streptosporangium brasiliense]